MQPARIDLDAAKSVFQVHGVDVDGNIVLRHGLRRAEAITFFAELPRLPGGS
jgi:transposase